MNGPHGSFPPTGTALRGESRTTCVHDSWAGGALIGQSADRDRWRHGAATLLQVANKRAELPTPMHCGAPAHTVPIPPTRHRETLALARSRLVCADDVHTRSLPEALPRSG
eukprot:352225-Chlamydomonas_euryale.AAC.10